MKWIKRIILAGLLLIVAVVVIAYFALNSILCSVIQKEATASLGVQTTLGSAHLSILGGKVDLEDLKVSSPPKFTAPDMFALGGVSVSVKYGQLTGSPIHIQQIVIDHPVLVVEQANVELNLQALMQQSSQAAAPASGGAPSQPMKLVIDDLELNDAQVTFMPGIPGLTDSIQVPVQSLSLKDIGNGDGNQTGAQVSQVVLQASTALAGKAVADSKMSPPVKAVLAQELAAVSGQLGSNFNEQFKNFAGTLTNTLAPKLGSELDQLLNGKKK
jgi:uncharacterized protein involved in outer membrane biogenesis